MSNALLSDVEARAERRRTRTSAEWWQELAQQAWHRASAADDASEARRWLERAHRLSPKDGMVACALAGRLLSEGALQRAADLFEATAAAHDNAEAWAGLATCAHLLGDAARARAALVEALHRRVPDEALTALADAVAPAGWCGLTIDGVLHVRPHRGTEVRLDGVNVPRHRSGNTVPLPDSWRGGGVLSVTAGGVHVLGSPLPLARFTGLEGFVEAEAGGLAGWAWSPADPACDPVVLVKGRAGRRVLRAEEPDERVTGLRPLARPRRFALCAGAVEALGPPLALFGPDGRHLLGSPLDPGLEARAAASPDQADFAPVWAEVMGPPPQLAPRSRPRGRPAAVIIPVYRGAAETLACLESVRASVPAGTKVVVVDDASPEPALVAALQDQARRRRITLLRQPSNQGFPAAVNAGLRAASGRDVVLLNSDTLVPPGWLDRLRDAAYAAPDIGCATPLTNDGTIVSYPDPAGGNPVPDLAGTVALDALAQRTGGGVVDIPVGVGFCLYIRRDCLDQVGPLREDLFAQGYGEENDWCLRARHRGWRSVAATGVYVGHRGGTSFGSARAHLVRRNGAILGRLHPGYDAFVAAHVAADPLGPVRRRMDTLRWARRRRAASGCVVMITHGGGGGVDRVVQRHADRARAEGLRAVLVQPWRGPAGAGVRVSEPGAEPTPNLVFTLPGEMAALLRLLRADRPVRVELHHLLGHEAVVAGLGARLGVDAVSVVHDYARFCPRIALVSTGRRYCGEPDVAGCEACVADLGSLLEDDPPVPVLLRRSAAELATASAIVVPSRDAGARMRRHFPGIAPMVEPWEDDRDLPPLDPAPAGPVRRVVVVGAIGVEKGYDVLLGCVRDAQARGLGLRFHVVGYTSDDERLLAAGPVEITGKYAEDEAVALIRAQAGQVAFIPSVWPETWCFALTRAWESGLAAAVFDLGAQAERVRGNGRGWLLPLGLQPPRVNDALLRLAPDRPGGQGPFIIP